MKKKFLMIIIFLIFIIIYQIIYLLFPFMPRLLPKGFYLSNRGSLIRIKTWQNNYYTYSFMATNSVFLTPGVWYETIEKEKKRALPGIYYLTTFDHKRSTIRYLAINYELVKKFYPKKDENSPTDILEVFYRENVKGFCIIYYNSFKRIHGVALLDYYGKDFHVIYKTLNENEFISDEKDVIADGRLLILNLKNGKRIRIYPPDRFIDEWEINQKKEKVIILKKSRKE